MKNSKILVHEPWKLSLVEEDINFTIDNPNEIIVKNIYSHISAGTELACVSGIEGWFPLPNTPGYTAIGKIIDKGANVNHVKIGDIVYTFGPHAENFKIDITDRWHGVVVKVPEGLPLDVASFTHMAGIAISSLRSSDIELGDIVIVSGLGAIGNLAAQFAQLQGATVIATDINESRIEIARKCGLDNVVNISKVNLGDVIKEICGKEKVNCWIDASGQSPVIEKGLEHIENNGELILLGSPRSSYQTDLTPVLRKIHLIENIRLKGALEFLFPTFQNEYNKHSIERNSAIIMDLMNKGKLKIKPFYTHLVKPKDAPEAYFGLKEKPDTYMGVVIDWQ